MTPRYVRNEPDKRESAAAAVVSGAVAIGVGVVTFYFARLFLAREPLPTAEDVAREDAGPSGD